MIRWVFGLSGLGLVLAGIWTSPGMGPHEKLAVTGGLLLLSGMWLTMRKDMSGF